MTAPYSRERTSLFLSFRSSVIRPTPSSYPPPSPVNRKGKGRAYDDAGEESTSLIRGMEETTLDFDLAPTQASPKWLALSQQVEGIIQRLPSKSQSVWIDIEGISLISFSIVAALDKLHSKHLLPAFTDRTIEEREIHTLTTQITTVRRPLFPKLLNSHSSSTAGLSQDPTAHTADSRHVNSLALVVKSIRSEEIGFNHGCERTDGFGYQGAGSQYRIPEETKGLFRSHAVFIPLQFVDADLWNCQK